MAFIDSKNVPEEVRKKVAEEFRKGQVASIEGMKQALMDHGLSEQDAEDTTGGAYLQFMAQILIPQIIAGNIPNVMARPATPEMIRELTREPAPGDNWKN